MTFHTRKLLRQLMNCNKYWNMGMKPIYFRGTDGVERPIATVKVVGFDRVVICETEDS